MGVFIQEIFCLPISNTEKKHMGQQYPLSTEYSKVQGQLKLWSEEKAICFNVTW